MVQLRQKSFLTRVGRRCAGTVLALTIQAESIFLVVRQYCVWYVGFCVTGLLRRDSTALRILFENHYKRYNGMIYNVIGRTLCLRTTPRYSMIGGERLDPNKSDRRASSNEWRFTTGIRN